MKRDNRGVSIIEMVIIMAILFTLLGGMINIAGVMSGKQARECTHKMNAALASIRTETMSKSTGDKDVSLTITKKNGSIYAVRKVKDSIKEDIIGDGKVKVSAYVSEEKVMDLETEGAEIIFYFNRETGGLQADAIQYDEIVIEQGRVAYKVSIVPVTGKFSYTRVQ